MYFVVAIASASGCGDSDAAADTSALASDAGERDKSDAGARTASTKDRAQGRAGSGGSSGSQPAGAGGQAARAPAREADASAASAEETKAADEQQPITLHFQAQVGDEPFACGRSYAAQGSTRQTVTPRDLRMFIQDVALVDDKGNEVPVKLDTRDPWQTADVALLDFEDARGECFGTADTNLEITGVVPKGKYSALRFSNGVPEKLNHSDPKLFPAPLKTPGMSWNWLLGLRFLRFETALQAPTSQTADSDAGADAASFALHIGSTACSGSQNAGDITCSKPNRSRIELKDFDVAKSQIVLDVSKLLAGSDLSKLVECHSASAVCEPMFKALGLSYETGKPAPAGEQSAFRLK